MGFHDNLYLSDVTTKLQQTGLEILLVYLRYVGRNSSVGIATGYGLDGPGIESRWGRDFRHLSRPALGPTKPPVQWVPGLSWGKERPERDADPSAPSSAVVRAIPVLPLLALRHVQSLSACTRVTFTFTFIP